MRIGQTTGAGIAALALLLAACGGDDDGDTTDASGTDGSVYAGELEDGSTLTVTLDVRDEATNDAYLELYEGPCGGQTLQVLAPGGETTTYVLVVDGDLPDFERLMAGLVNELEPT